MESRGGGEDVGLANQLSMRIDNVLASPTCSASWLEGSQSSWVNGVVNSEEADARFDGDDNGRRRQEEGGSLLNESSSSSRLESDCRDSSESSDWFDEEKMEA